MSINFNNPNWGRIKNIILIVFIMSLFVLFVGALASCQEAAQVAREEFGPRASLKKYEWFKDASSQLEKKRRDIEIYSQRLNGLIDTYPGVPRREWDRLDKQTYNQISAELSGVRSSYNKLAAEYNAQSDKFNWSIYKGNSDIPPNQYKQLN
jgi:hypothetical protein